MRRRHALLAGEPRQRVVREHQHVVAALAQRRHVQLDDVDAVVQVLAEAALGDELAQVLVRRAQDADVDRQLRSLGPTGRIVFSWITRSSLTCMCSGRSATSSRNSVPPSAVWNRPGLSLTAPVKLPFLWPKNSLSMSSVGIAPQLIGTNGPLAPRPGLVDHARDELLAGARFAGDVHRRLAARDLARPSRARARSAAIWPTRPSVAALRGTRGAFELQGRRHELAQVVEVERLRDEVERAGLQRADGRFDAAVRGDHRDRRAGHLALNPLDELEPVAVGQAHVGQAQIERLLAERLLGAS